MTDRTYSTLPMDSRDALAFQNRSQVFSKDVTTFAIDPLGKVAVLCGKRGLFFVRLDEEKLDIFRTVRDPKNAGKDISGVRWSRNPNILASTCLQELSLWDINSTQPVPLLSKVACHRRAITGFDWSNHQEHVLATASFDADSMVYLWDMRDAGTPLKFHSLRSPFGGASAVKWSRREEHLLAASNGTQLLVWDVRKDAAPIVAVPADLKPLVDFDWSYRDDMQVLTCAPNSIKFWNLSNPKKPLATFSTPTNRARYCPFSRSCVTLTGLSDHSWDLWNISDLTTPFLVKEYGIEDLEDTSKSLGPLSKFNWRRSLVGSTFEYQLVTWSTKDQLLSLWCIEAEEMESCGVEPSKLKRSWSTKHAEAKKERLREQEEQDLLAVVASLGIGTQSEDPSLSVDETSPLSSPRPTTSLKHISSGISLDSMQASSSHDGTFSAEDSDLAPGSSGKLWDVASRDSTDSEATTSSYSQAPSSTSQRSRAGSSSLTPAVGNASNPTSPPGSFKAALTSPGSTRRTITTASSSNASTSSSHHASRQSLTRAVSFEVEIDQLMKHPFVGLTLDKLDKPSRIVIFSLRRGKIHVEIKITFPTMYPHGAPPSFTVLTNTSADSTVKTKALLVDTAEDYVAMNRNCVAPALSQLVEYLSTQDNAVMEAASIESNSKDVEEALTRHRRASLSASASASSSSASSLLPALHQLTSAASSSLSSSSSPSSVHSPTSPRHSLSVSSVSSDFTEYIVKPTDSLAAIALFFNMTVGELRKLNKIQHSVQLLPGQVLLVKKLAPHSATPTTPSSGSHTPYASSHSGAHSPTGSPFHNVNRQHHSKSVTLSHEDLIHSAPVVVNDAEATRNTPGPQKKVTYHIPHEMNKTIHRVPAHDSSGPAPDLGATHKSSSSAAIPVRRGDAASNDSSASPVVVGSLLGSPSGLKSRAKLFDGPGLAAAGAPTKKEEILVHALRCKFVDRTLNPPVLIEGLLTATPSNLFFEPDLEQPMVAQRGALHYSIYLEMKKIREASDLKSMNLSLTASEDEQAGGVYLQILTKDRQTINHSKVLLFLTSNQTKTEEVSQAMKRWISSQTEKSLVDALGLDTVNAPQVPSFSQSLTSSGNIAKGPGAIRHVAGDILSTPSRGTSALSSSSGTSSIRSSAASVTPASSSSGSPSKPKSTESAERALSLFDSIASTLGFAPMNSPSNHSSSSGSHQHPNSAKSNDPSKNLGKPPTRPAPKIGSPESLSSFKSNLRPGSPSKSGSKAAGSNQGSKLVSSAPNEDPDDLPKLLGSGALLNIEAVWTLRMHIPMRFKYHDWQLAFSTSVHGTSLLTFYKHLDGKAPTVLVVRDTDGHVFGGYASEAWHVSRAFFGTGESFLFSILPNFAVYTWTGADDYYLVGKRDFLAMGGGGTSGRYGLWLDQELSAGTSEVCKTFLNRRLSLNEEFKCASVEVYHLVPK